jgi:hypothetical protein
MTPAELDELVRRFSASELPRSEWTHAVLLRFYSRARLESVEARLGWLEPDLAPLSLDAAGS